MPPEADDGTTGHILQELAFATTARDEGEVRGVGTITPHLRVPGTASVRASVLATWLDTVAGHVALLAVAPRVPVTIELDLHLHRPPPGDGEAHARARPLKVGRSVAAVAVELTDSAGTPIATGGGSFTAAPDPGLRMPPDILLSTGVTAPARELHRPLAERVGCARGAAGVATLERRTGTLNTAGTINGGILTLAIEEAALSLAPGRTLASLSVRYLRPVRVGRAVATATARGDLALVEVRDAGAGDRLAAVATTRTFAPG